VTTSCRKKLTLTSNSNQVEGVLRPYATASRDAMPEKDQEVVMTEMSLLMSDNINNNSTMDKLNAKVNMIAIQIVTMARLKDPKLKAEAQNVHLNDWLVKALGRKNLKNYAKIDVIMKIAQEQGVDASGLDGDTQAMTRSSHLTGWGSR
jgi:hypothetical protein